MTWIGTSYFAVTAGEVATKLLAGFNLSTLDAPTWLEINGSITKDPSKDVPTLEPIVRQPAEYVTLERVTIAGAPAFIRTRGATADYAVFVRPDSAQDSYRGAHVALNRGYFDAFCAEIGDDPELRQELAGELRPVHLIGERGRAVLMPVRIG